MWRKLFSFDRWPNGEVWLGLPRWHIRASRHWPWSGGRLAIIFARRPWPWQRFGLPQPLNRQYTLIVPRVK